MEQYVSQLSEALGPKRSRRAVCFTPDSLLYAFALISGGNEVLLLLDTPATTAGGAAEEAPGRCKEGGDAWHGQESLSLLSAGIPSTATASPRPQTAITALHGAALRGQAVLLPLLRTRTRHTACPPHSLAAR